MLALLLHVGNEVYGLDVCDVHEVVPYVELKAVPHAPAFVAGLFSFRGAVVPVIDLSRVLGNAPSQVRLSTRIVLAQVGADEPSAHLVGLLAERVTETTVVDEAELQSPGIRVDETPYLGRIASIGNTMIQLVRVEHLLTPELRERLFSTDTEALP